MNNSIVHVAEFIGSMNDGGAETLVKDYALLIDKTKFSIEIFTIYGRDDSANSKRLKDANICIRSVFKKRTFFTIVVKKILGRWYIPFKIRKLLKLDEINVLHIHLDLLKYIRPIRKEIKTVKLFYTCHNLPNLFFCGKRKAEGVAAKILEKENHLRFIALHSQMAEEIENLLQIKKCFVIKNGIDFKIFENVTESKVEIRKSLGIPETCFLVGHIGRFSVQKNHKFLIDVFSKIKEKKDDAKLLMIGNGKLKNQIETLVKNKGLKNDVVILSNRTDIPRLLKAMDVFIFPSLFEGLGIVLVEAQVSKIRCIISDSVPKAVFLSNYAIAASLNQPANYWAELALNNEFVESNDVDNLKTYDMNTEIKKLENLYLS